MTYTLNDSQKEILGREMQPNEIDAWVNGIWDIAEERNKGSGNAAVEAKFQSLNLLDQHMLTMKCEGEAILTLEIS